MSVPYVLNMEVSDVTALKPAFPTHAEMPNNVFDDPKLSVVAKMFLAAVVSVVLGKPSNIRIRGSIDQVEATKQAILATVEFRDCVNSSGVTIQDIMDKLKAKNIAAQRFKTCLNIPWPF
jgi:hypothetical protein